MKYIIEPNRFCWNAIILPMSKTFFSIKWMREKSETIDPNKIINFLKKNLSLTRIGFIFLAPIGRLNEYFSKNVKIFRITLIHG